jgi:uncharacterized protein YprB with RNaseH-like and TPR domain
MDEADGVWDDKRKGTNDKSVVQSCLNKLKEFDVLVTHFGSPGRYRCDYPYLLTRALFHGLDIPSRTEYRHIDLQRVARDRLRLSRNSQAVLALLLRKKTRKSPVDGVAWSDAIFRGNQKALNQIVEHCYNDVLDLKDNYYALKKQIGKANP